MTMFRFLTSGCLALALFSPVSLAWAETTSVSGTVYFDSNADGLKTADESLSGVTIQLFEDNGDGIFNPQDDLVAGSTVTNPNGEYQFDTLDRGIEYFVVQPSQALGSLNVPDTNSGLLTPSDYNRFIDRFADQQNVEANPIFGIGNSNLTSNTVIGGQRDLHLEYLSGPAESTLRSNPFGLNEVLEFAQTAGVISRATVTWDGKDADLSTTPAPGGLGGMDLTADGSTAIGFELGVDKAGVGEKLTLRIFSGDDVSEVQLPIPETDGNATVYRTVPFADFVGDASFTSVDAIQLEVGGNLPSIDLQLRDIGLVGPKVVDLVSIPEPAAASLLATLLGFAGLARRRRR